jgi:hypothetical protein
MRQILAAVILTVVGFSLCAEEGTSIVGKWEGKDKKNGKSIGIEFKADKSVVMMQDGKVDGPPGGSISWEIVDADEGHLNIVIKDGKDSVTLPMLFEIEGETLKMGVPKTEARAASMEEAEVQDFKRAKDGAPAAAAGGGGGGAEALVGTWEGKSPKNGKVRTITFKADKSLEMMEDGKKEEMPGVTLSWSVPDAAKGHLDMNMKMDGNTVNVPLIYEFKDGKLKIGGPVGEKRAPSLAESDDPIDFTKK